MWGGLPAPGLAKVPLSGLALSHATNSFKSFAGTEFLERITSELLATCAIGSKSLSKSKGSYSTAPSTTCVPHWPRPIVYPSAAALPTRRTAMPPEDG